jgi:glycosyltransferase involved in cell wall biosynthesis
VNPLATFESMQTGSQLESPAPSAESFLKGKRVGMVMFSSYPADPRPRRAIETLLKEGMSVDLVCLEDGDGRRRETRDSLEVIRVPLTHKRGGKLSYAYKYSAFIATSAGILAVRSLKQKYDLVYVHNMPDVLVASALVPKLMGAKVILDQHDPMPELMMTIFGMNERSGAVRLLARLEKWSIGRADLVITVNAASKRIFGSRSCSPEKIGIVMNSPDEAIFPFRATQPVAATSNSPGKRLVMMYHGSLVERNGLDLAVAALAKVRATIPNVELRIYGRETPFLQKVMTQAQMNDLAGSISYLGPKSLEALVGEIESCDVGVIPNQRSAFAEINTPTRIFEYLALGKPVIAPRTLGITDYFDEDSMIFFEVGDAGDLAEKVKHVVSHPAEVAEVVKRGQEVYREHCWQTEKERLVGLVGGLLSGTADYVNSAGSVQQKTRSAAGPY